MHRITVGGACALLLLVGSLRAQSGGNGGAGNLTSEPFVLGSTANVAITGPAGAGYGLWISDNVAPVLLPGQSSMPGAGTQPVPHSPKHGSTIRIRDSGV